MKINKHNYEAWFLDYTEGNLSEADKQELSLFLEQNAKLKKELEEYEAITLPTNNPVFEGKEQLKKPVFADDILISYLENNLGANEKTELEKAIAAHTYLKKEMDLYRKTISVPDAAVVFERKEKLIKRRFVIIWNNPVNYFRAAAAILLLTGLIILITRQLNKEPKSIMAKNKEVISPKDETVPNNVSPSPTTLPQNTLMAVQEQKTTITKKKSSYTNKQDSLHKVIHTNQPTLVVNDTVEKTNAQENKLVQNNTKQDTLNNQQSVAVQENDNQSYFNHATDADEDNKAALQAKVNPTQTKKPFFKFLSFAAKGAKQLGAKHIDVKESVNEDIITMGGIALSETTSN